MTFRITRRAALVGCAMAIAAAGVPAAYAQDRPVLRFAAVFGDADIRADAIRNLTEAIADEFTLEPHFGGTLFRQGTELVALQRGNLETGIVAPQDIANQLPEWSILTAGYMFRDPDHLKRFFESDAGQEMIELAEERLGIHIVTPVYYGTRQLNLKGDRRVETPADLSGIRIRMPGGDAWQFLGEALGANPTPMAYPEVYTGLQTGAIDAQDNPLPNNYNMKFYEVTDQTILTSHLIAFDVFAVSRQTWEGLTPEQQQRLEEEVSKAIDWSTERHLEEEQRLAGYFEEQGHEVYTPDLDAFREHVQQKYLESDLARDWPEGMVERINAL
jgi:TRAP-type transport system periplasmic protein